MEEAVRSILDDVQSRGDEALFEYTKKYEQFRLTPSTLKVKKKE